MPKYAPAREDGLKPYVVTVTSWGNSVDHLVWAHDAGDARYQGKGRQLHTHAKARRATPDDMEQLNG